jgi:NAD(P)-dependent dehydrogenase (short-subunit alcohol dehydrogenase family)
MDLLNKVCIVTGGAKGIGRNIVEAFCEEGASLCIWDLDIKPLNALGKTLIKNNNILKNKIIIQKVDVTNSYEIRKAIITILQKFGTIHILVNNVGLYTVDDITKEDEKNWNKIIDTNLKSVFLCIKEVLPTMIENRYGKIVNISSISGKKESIFASPSYCASKAGIIGLTRCVAAQIAKYSINANCVAPAITDTDIISILGNSKIESALKSIPLGRIGKPEDITNAVLFLVKDSSNFITGETINVNGGSFME